jgi:hypothetical protein
MQCERARQKMSRAFFTPFGKTCHMLLPVILAKDVANTSRQEVTLLSTLYLLFITIGKAASGFSGRATLTGEMQGFPILTNREPKLNSIQAKGVFSHALRAFR